MNIATRILIVSSMFMLSACATLDKDQCLTADWEVIGYEDGTRGYQASRIGDHRKACAKYGVAPELASYTRGRDRGLHVYCTPQNGFKVGQTSSVFRDVCPGPMRAAFRKAWEYGSQIRTQRYDIRRLDSEILQSREAIQAMQEEIDLNEALIIRGAKGPRERAVLVRRNRELYRLIEDEDDRISRAAYEIEQIEYAIGELIEHSPYN